MTVEDLIAKLLTMPQDAVVKTDACDGCGCFGIVTAVVNFDGEVSIHHTPEPEY